MAQLCLQHSEFLALNTEIYVISFGIKQWARVWQEETGVPFTLLLDPERAAYRAYRLERSMFRSWGPKTFLRYARLMLAGRRWRGIKGDSGQLGVISSSMRQALSAWPIPAAIPPTALP